MVEILRDSFGWTSPICFECGETMTVIHLTLNDLGDLGGKCGNAFYQCFNSKGCNNPYIVFERKVGIDSISRYGWDNQRIKMTPRIKLGDKVEINGKIVYIHSIERGRPYPYYVHLEKDINDNEPLYGPYGKDEIKIID